MMEEIDKRIRMMRSADQSAAEMARTLNDQGLKTMKGGPITPYYVYGRISQMAKKGLLVRGQKSEPVNGTYKVRRKPIVIPVDETTSLSSSKVVAIIGSREDVEHLISRWAS